MTENAKLPVGCYVMGLTPFDRGGSIDEAALREHVQWMAASPSASGPPVRPAAKVP